MSDAFVSLADFLKPAPPELQALAPPASPPVVPEELETTLRAARRFRAALRDALEAALPELLRSIAAEVLGRELQLEPVAIARVVTAALDRAAGDHVLAIRVHPSEHDAVAELGFTTIAESGLRAGDCRIELRSGTIDASLGVRLETVLAALAP